MAKAMGAIASTSTFTQSEMKSSHRRIWGQDRNSYIKNAAEQRKTSKHKLETVNTRL